MCQTLHVMVMAQKVKHAIPMLAQRPLLLPLQKTVQSVRFHVLFTFQKHMYCPVLVCLASTVSTQAQYGCWTAWSSCSVTCGGGERTRTGECKPGSDPSSTCTGDGTEREECNTDACEDCSVGKIFMFLYCPVLAINV